MPKYVVLMNWTDTGVKNVKDTVDRYHKAKPMVEKLGGTIDDVYWTSGSHDLVCVVSAVDDEALAATLLTLAGTGALRTEVLRAFDESEMKSIISKMP